MDESKEQLTAEELRKKAYLMGLRLKNSGLDTEAIYARLEKQGIPEEIARQVARDTLIERKREAVQQHKPDFTFALIRIGIGVIMALISHFLLPGVFIFPVIIIIAGIVSAFLAKK